MQQQQLHTPDGTELALYVQRPAGISLGNVLLIHGLCEHAGRYLHVMHMFAQAGLTVFAADLRGHGRSAGRRGDVLKYQCFLDDLDFLLTYLAQQNSLPTLLYAHSLGGGIAGRYLTGGQPLPPQLRGAVLTAPWFLLADPLPVWQVKAFRLAAYLLPAWRLPAAPPIEHLTSDPEAAQRILADPFYHRRISLRLAVQAYDAGQATLASAAQCKLPVLALHSPDDRVTSAKAAAEFCQRAPQAELRLYPGQAHELHNELNWKQLLTPAVDWMLNQCAVATTSRHT